MTFKYQIIYLQSVFGSLKNYLSGRSAEAQPSAHKETENIPSSGTSTNSPLTRSIDATRAVIGSPTDNHPGNICNKFVVVIYIVLMTRILDFTPFFLLLPSSGWRSFLSWMNCIGIDVLSSWWMFDYIKNRYLSLLDSFSWDDGQYSHVHWIFWIFQQHLCVLCMQASTTYMYIYSLFVTISRFNMSKYTWSIFFILYYE